MCLFTDFYALLIGLYLRLCDNKKMKIILLFHKSPVRVTKITYVKSRLKLRRSMLNLKAALAQEKAETKQMLSVYKKYTRRQATPEEIKFANEQFLDILKGLGLSVFAVLPFAPITIPILVKVGRLVGVEVLPSSFNKSTTALTKSLDDDKS